MLLDYQNNKNSIKLENSKSEAYSDTVFNQFNEKIKRL
ncbi:hypothetical protein [Borreliella andersonii]